MEILDYAAVVDCGTVINPNLAGSRPRAALSRELEWPYMRMSSTTKRGHMMNNSFMQYKIPTRLDMGRLRVEFESRL